MRAAISLPKHLSQNNKLPIRIVSPAFGHLSPEARGQYERTQSLPYYFFVFMVDGVAQYGIDLEKFDIGKHELLFSLPHQMLERPATIHGSDYYKLGFDEECLSRLPRQYPFLLNPFSRQKISFSSPAAVRVQAIFNILSGLLNSPDTDPELILAHLNGLMTEFNTAYFMADKKPSDEKLTQYIGFKVFVENTLTDHPSIKDIAEQLALSTDKLYQIVKQYSGLSPKEFITNRLILEAKRRMYHGDHSVKELALELGFSDPDYFSRLFKKITGKTVARFFQDLS